MVISGTNGLTFNNSTTQASAGQVLQVVSTTYSTAVSNSTTTFIDTGLTATITPKFSTSKVLVLVSHSTYKGPANATNGCSIKLFRGATDLGRIIWAQGYTNNISELYSQAAIQYLDSPATTSATAYKTQFANLATSALVSVQADSVGLSTITLMEIAG
jgi:hypothetical protein